MEALGLTPAAEFDRVFAEAKQAMDSPCVRCVAPCYVASGQARLGLDRDSAARDRRPRWGCQ
jgi:hypothetical protein